MVTFEAGLLTKQMDRYAVWSARPPVHAAIVIFTLLAQHQRMPWDNDPRTFALDAIANYYRSTPTNERSAEAAPLINDAHTELKERQNYVKAHTLAKQAAAADPTHAGVVEKALEAVVIAFQNGELPA